MRRAHRLRHRREFAKVYRRGRPFRGALLVLRALASGRDESRFGFTAGRALGNAVTRNRTKRRLREAARTLPVGPGWDLVVNSRRGAGEASYWELRAELEKLLGRAGVLEESNTAAQ
jgi:ribonuclease P protein component